MARQQLQFSILALLALTALVAVVLWVTAGEASAFKAFVLLALVPGFLGLSLVGSWSTDGYGRAFFLGTLATSFFISVAFPTFWWTSDAYDIAIARQQEWVLSFGQDSVRTIIRVLWGLMLPVGLLCVAFRWLLVRGGGSGGKGNG